MSQSNGFVPAVIDLEASGFGKGSYPIEVGVALADGSTHCYLIRPQSDWVCWHEESEKLHGIRREVLLRHGRSVEKVADELNRLLEGCTVYSDGWGFDNTWVALLFEAARRRQTFKIAQLQALFNEQQYNSWHETYQTVTREFDSARHRASSDAFLIQQTFLRSRGLPVEPQGRADCARSDNC